MRETSYTEGTSLSLGVRLPVDDGYSCEVVSYLSGVRVRAASTNQTLSITRVHASSNNWFGIVHTVEGANTKVKLQ